MRQPYYILFLQSSTTQFFPVDNRFKNILLSSGGIESHRRICNHENCKCAPHIRICKQKCFKSLKRKVIPKFSIANGNWFGQLTSHLNNMSYGTKSLLRPVNISGWLASFNSQTYAGGTKMTGHVYSTKLDTPFVRKYVPLDPSDVSIRVIIVLPFCTCSRKTSLY